MDSGSCLKPGITSEPGSDISVPFTQVKPVIRVQEEFPLHRKQRKARMDDGDPTTLCKVALLHLYGNVSPATFDASRSRTRRKHPHTDMEPFPRFQEDPDLAACAVHPVCLILHHKTNPCMSDTRVVTGKAGLNVPEVALGPRSLP